MQAVAMDAAIYEAIRIMVTHNLTGLPIIEGSRPLFAIVSHKDVIRPIKEARLDVKVSV